MLQWVFIKGLNGGVKKKLMTNDVVKVVDFGDLSCFEKLFF
jgi:hypothetical protein